MPTDPKTTEWYNQNAEHYAAHVRDARDSVYHAFYEKPAMYALLPDLRGKSVLSVGCGSGEDSSYLLTKGAAQSIGIDLSAELVKIAKRSHPACEFHVMDMQQLDFPDQSFDFAYSSLAIHYLEDWSRALIEVYRVLKPGSFFLFSCHSPVESAMLVTQDDNMTKIKQLSWKKEKVGDKIEIVGDYLNRRKLAGVPSFPVATWHKSVSDIAADVFKSGFLIADIIEPKPLPEFKEYSPLNYERLLRIPHFMIFKLYKV